MPSQRSTFQTDDLWLGEFRCPPGDQDWARTNLIGQLGPIIAFPRTPVRIRHEGRPEVLADPTRAVLYHAGQPYRRGLASAEGDACSFIGFSREIAAEAATGFDPAAADPATYRFPFSVAPIDRHDHLRHHRLRANLARGSTDADAVREELFGMVSRSVRAGYASSEPARQRRAATVGEHREIVEAVRSELSADLSARLSLDDLATLVHVSPFHLSRVFREATGQSIHAYRTDVRLRVSLELIAAGVGLAKVAIETGFASHAHLSDRFRHAYGMAPHEWRDGLKRNREMSRIVEVGRGAAPVG